MSETVKLDFEIQSPIARVWEALTDSATLSKWMMFKTNDFEPVVGHTFQFRDAPGYDGIIDGEVTMVDEPNRLSYTWTAPGQDGEPHSTLVTWSLSVGDGGVTKLHLEQSGFRSGAKQEIGGAKYGWMSMVEQLQTLLGAE
ncbi:MAG TPA: SRPBCC domain-containing protein [Longimicrobiaceae bacterium]|nr:SRPBCC domain-containing protein [Longimicrobiaceae bacterium]